MKCIYCEKETKIIDSRVNQSNNKKRRRECLECNKRFTTIEILKEDYKDMKIKSKKLSNKTLFNLIEIKKDLLNADKKIKELEKVIRILKSRERGFKQ